MKTLILTLANGTFILCALILIGLATQKIRKLTVQVISLVYDKWLAYTFINVITFIGTIHHELTHAFMATLTGAKVTELKCFNFGRNGKIGYVKYKVRGGTILRNIQYCLTSIAPALLTPITLFITWYAYLKMPILQVLRDFPSSRPILYYITTSLILHMNLSGQDMKMAKKGMPVCFLLLCIIIFIFRIDFVSPIIERLNAL